MTFSSNIIRFLIATALNHFSFHFLTFWVLRFLIAEVLCEEIMEEISNVRVVPNNATCTVRRFLASTPASQVINMLKKVRW